MTLLRVLPSLYWPPTGLQGFVFRHELTHEGAPVRHAADLQAGYPIASGVIEGACRHIIKDRMEQGGMRWRLVGAEAMLNVRAVCASSEWEEFGRWRQLEQAKRVHPHRGLVSEYCGFTA